MKLPSLSKDTVVDFLLRHVEKIVVSIIAVLAMGLAWGGIDALRSQTVTADKRPEALSGHARRTLEHIDREKQPPSDVVPRPPSLTKLVEPWRAPRVSGAPDMALLDTPLFEELDRRTRPEVFPIEDVRATAGIAVFASKPQAGGDAGPSGRIVPYVVVTGLIPVAKQNGDYARRFQSTSLRDPKRDSPLWSDYLVERSTVVAGGRETWERIDLKAVAKKAREQWAGFQSEPLMAKFLLAPEQHPGSGGIAYCGPLPQLAMEGWGPEALHPWFQKELDRLRAEREAAAKADADEAAASGQPAEDREVSPLDETAAGAAAAVQPLGPSGQPAAPLDYRLFRFVDTGVESGKAYRYRVRLSVWNPNYNVPAQHLADAALAKDVKLPSQPSNVTPAVTVPGSVTALVRTLPKADMKRFKPGMAEVLVLAPDGRAGNYALRGVITDLGGFVNVDRKLNKPGDVRVRGEEITTNSLLIDMAGRQENREDLRAARSAAPPEPLELILMREDGGFEIVTAADSEASIARHAATLPAADGAKTGAKQPGDAGSGPPSKDTPFSFPGLGPR